MRFLADVWHPNGPSTLLLLSRGAY
jgi:hypothetical protein